MRLRDNDVGGIFWDRSIRPEKAARQPRAPKELIITPMPHSDWTPPQELPSLDGVRRISVDVETKDPDLKALGPGPRRPGNKIVGLALGIDRGTNIEKFYFPVAHEGGGNLDEGLIRRWAKEELNAYRGTVLGAKLDYDLDWLAEWGIDFPVVEGFDDVQIAEPLIDEQRYSFSLDALATDYLGERKIDGLLLEAGRSRGWKTPDEIKTNLWRLPASMVGAYAEGDVDLPLRIFPKQREILEREDLVEVYEKCERPLIPILVAMRRRGVRVDLDRAEQARAFFVKERDKWVAEMRRLASPKAELMAVDSFAQALIDSGVRLSKTAKSGQWSVTKDVLSRNLENPLAFAIYNGRKVETIINTFMDGHILGHQINGRIHAQWKQLKDDGGGTIARIASADPNLANIIGRDDDSFAEELREVAAKVRGVFVPEDGEDWGRADLSQIEYRLLAHFAIGPGSEEVRRRYNEDPKTDFHKLCAELAGIDPDDKRKRKMVKGINFARTYGARGPKLAQLLRCSLEEAENFIEIYDEKLPFNRATFEAAQKWASKHGYVRTILNRRRHFDLWEPTGNYGKDKKPPLRRDDALAKYGTRISRYMTHASLNGKMQGSNADYMKKIMVDCQRAGVCDKDALGPWLLTIYDEGDVSVPKTQKGREAWNEMLHIMETAIPLKVPVLVDGMLGDDWGAAL